MVPPPWKTVGQFPKEQTPRNNQEHPLQPGPVITVLGAPSREEKALPALSLRRTEPSSVIPSTADGQQPTRPSVGRRAPTRGPES